MPGSTDIDWGLAAGNVLKYYSLLMDMSRSSRILSSPMAPDGSILAVNNFTNRTRYPGGLPLTIPIFAPGLKSDIEFASVPVVSLALAEKLGIYIEQDVELIPAHVGDGQGEACKLLNILSECGELDETRSEFELAKPQRQSERSLPGRRYRSIRSMILVPGSDGGAHIFRFAQSSSTVVVSSDVRQILLDANATGATYQEV